jgi:tetratricopeptide (TPR) repeat protein
MENPIIFSARKRRGHLCVTTPIKLQTPLKQNAAIILLVAVAFFLTLQNASAQKMNGMGTSTTPQVHKDFPFQAMWDDAVCASKISRKPALAFDLDLIDSNSIQIAREVIGNKKFQTFLRAHFEPALNDFAIDPPFTVGLDSLRNLGLRLSGLERTFRIGLRPTIIMIGPDSEEMDRIVFPQKLTVAQFEARLMDILHDRHTLHSAIVAFWQDTASLSKRQHLIDMFEERSKYDSVLYHLGSLSRDIRYPNEARKASARYADLRMKIEGNVVPLDSLIASLGHSKSDSLLHYTLLQDKLAFYQRAKKADSVSAMFERIMAFTSVRDPDLLNDYAWNLANETKDWNHALALVDEAIGKNAREPNYYDTRALVNAQLNRFDEAVHDSQTALRYASGNDVAYFKDRVEYFKGLRSRSQATLQSPSNQSKQK